MDEITFFASRFGALSGGLSLFVLLQRFHEERANLVLKPSLIEGNQNCYFFAKAKFNDDFSAPYRVIMQVDITNKSARPISILEFRLNIENKGQYYSTQYLQALDYYEFDMPTEKTLKIPVGINQLKPIITLQQFTSIRGFLFFPIKDILLEDRYNCSVEVFASRKPWYFKKSFKTKNILITRLPIR